MAYTDLCLCVPVCDYDICVPGQVTVSEQSKLLSIVLYCFTETSEKFQYCNFTHSFLGLPLTHRCVSLMC